MSYLNKVPYQMHSLLEKDGVAWCYPRMDKVISDQTARAYFRDDMLGAAPKANQVPNLVWSAFYGDEATPESIVLSGWVRGVDEEIMDQLLDKTCAVNTVDNGRSVFESDREMIYRYKKGEDFLSFMKVIGRHYKKYENDDEPIPFECRPYNPEEENKLNINNLKSSVSYITLNKTINDLV
ncbi:MAG: hypothetical protein R3Y43_08585 [Alphaproteobacteria bacterium]